MSFIIYVVLALTLNAIFAIVYGVHALELPRLLAVLGSNLFLWGALLPPRRNWNASQAPNTAAGQSVSLVLLVGSAAWHLRLPLVAPPLATAFETLVIGIYIAVLIALNQARERITVEVRDKHYDDVSVASGEKLNAVLTGALSELRSPQSKRTVHQVEGVLRRVRRKEFGADLLASEAVTRAIGKLQLACRQKSTEKTIEEATVNLVESVAGQI